MAAYATHDDRIDLFVHAATSGHTTAALRLSNGIPGETTTLVVAEHERRNIAHIAHSHGITLEPWHRYATTITGETHCLRILTDTISPASLSSAIADALIAAAGHNSRWAHTAVAAHALHLLAAGPYGSDPTPTSAHAATLAVLLNDTGLIPSIPCTAQTGLPDTLDGHTLSTLLGHAHTASLVHVAEALARST